MTARLQPAGLASLQRRLAGLSGAARAAANEGLRQAGADILAEARARLEAGSSDPEGNFAASLSASLDPDASRLTIASNSPHAAFLEFGTRRSGARPFLRPAVAARRAAMLGSLRNAVAGAMNRLMEMP